MIYDYLVELSRGHGLKNPNALLVYTSIQQRVSNASHARVGGKITDSTRGRSPDEVGNTTGRQQDLLEQALGCESAELARLYASEMQLAEIIGRAEQAAEALLSTVFQMPIHQTAEFSSVFAIKLKQLMKEPCGGDLEAPRGH